MIQPIEDVIHHQRLRLESEQAQNLYIHRSTLQRLLDAAEGLTTPPQPPAGENYK